MQKRANRDGGYGWRKKATDGKDRLRKRNEQRLGGKGLSLEAFANAKSRSSSVYNPALIKKQREFYRNAKLVNKYKKEVKQENISSQHLPTTLDDEEDQTENQQMQSKTKKKTFRSLKEEYEKKHAEDEKARIEREVIIQAKNEERAKNEAKRKAQREKMFKKTRFGQPVMKYRIEHILEGLLESSKKQA
ncbi:uncharacterized protein LOC122051257 [Zingiber officinale]|uniref:rRNA-processing protein FYV7 n=1 Tax=Zingiber officinale TaxID=94328 RepID=A0A8J5HBK2_ZINOF|nr:uncharacterized protein LOC122051257 [Zingiber officinale]KAG6520285.1 hypothetical protein ZIOFF_017325 [Zingiber officinale]